MSPPNQGFRYKASLTAAASDGTGVLVASCGASRGGGFQLSGTFSATLQFEQTLDNGTTWIAKTVFPAGGGAGVTSATAAGQWKFACGGETQVRVRCSAYVSGTIVVDSTFTAGLDQVALPGGSASNPLPVTQGASPVGGGITYADRTITSATGASQQLMAANAGRKTITIKNGASPTGVNILAGTAAIGGAGTMTLQPFESLRLTGADCPLGAINVICTAAAYISAFEGT